MQSVDSIFTAEEKDSVRSIVASLLTSWKKEVVTATTFTIGVSTIGGDDYIGLNPGAIGGPGVYRYFDDSDYAQSLAWERELNIPTGGLNKAYAEGVLDNTSGRYLPSYMGGDSELFTAILPRRPIIINAGFNYGGIDNTLPQFSGMLTNQPEVNKQTGLVGLKAADYVDYFYNKFLDKEIMFTGLTTDQVIENLFISAGMSTAQYDLDTGLNEIAFGLFERGSRYSDVINKVVEAENAQLYQDETGVFKFENRQHWYTSPYNEVQLILATADVINAQAPSEDTIINVVEIKSKIREKSAEQLIYQTQETIELGTTGTVEYFISYEDPVLEVTSVTIIANDAEDGSGTDRSSNVVYNKTDFAQASKFIFSNTHSSTIYITNLQVNGRPAKVVSEIYHRQQDDSSVTAYQERIFTLDNEYIQSVTWAQSLALVLLQSFSEPQNLQDITIRAKPRLQLGDLLSWQGHYWRIYGIKTRLDPSQGFVQDLKMLISSNQSYFTIGVSTIGGSDVIAA